MPSTPPPCYPCHHDITSSNPLDKAIKQVPPDRLLVTQHQQRISSAAPETCGAVAAMPPRPLTPQHSMTQHIVSHCTTPTANSRGLEHEQIVKICAHTCHRGATDGAHLFPDCARPLHGSCRDVQWDGICRLISRHSLRIQDAASHG